MNIYNVAVIGAGHMGMQHIKRIGSVPNARLLCVVDTNMERAESAAVRYNAAHVFNNYKQAIDLPETDIVIISTYANTHLEILEYALEKGKHVLCEKPMTPDIETSKKFVEMAKASNSKVLVGHILRFHEGFKKLKELIDKGGIGSPVLIRMTHNHHIMDKEKYQALLSDASPIVDCGIHYVDIMRYFTGSEVTDVSGIGMVTNDDCPENSYNYGVINLKFADGSAGVYEAGWGNTIASNVSNEFIGPKGRLKFSYAIDRPWNKEEGDLIEYYCYETGTYETINVLCDRRPTDCELSHLIDMIEENAKEIPSLDDVYRAFEICVLADEEIRKNL
jgi:predicted dehydrogenase